MRPPDLAQCRAMLACISAADRDTWVRMGMALHSEYPGTDGFAAFDAWSQTAESYDTKATRATWKSYKPGPVKIGTLIDEAKRHGFTFEVDGANAPAESPDDIARRNAEREQRAKIEKAAIAKRQEQTAKTAQTALQGASDTGTSEYLARKRCGAYGLKFARDGAVLVPMQDGSGAILNVQRILPNGEKRFLPGGRKSGLWHWVGAIPADNDYNGPLLIAEGYATAASLYEACALPCAVALDCGNLMHVAHSVRGRFPNARIVVCADDDANNKTKHPDGSNPGLTKARAAANGIRGMVAVPAVLPDGMTDFNDLSLHAGAPAVKACVTLALTENRSAQGTPANAPNDDSADRFSVTEEGVFVEAYDPQSKRAYPARVCQSLWVPARTRNSDGGEWGYRLEFNDPQGKRKAWVLPSRMLAGEGTDYRAQLASLGFAPPQGQRERRWLTDYILSRQVVTFAKTVRRIGWHDERNVFVLPGEVIKSDEGEPVYLQSDGDHDQAFCKRGTLDTWRAQVAARAVGNSRLIFGISCALSGPLLEPAQQAGGGFNLKGDSSEGKTSALHVAASVWGGHSFVLTWRATDSALEHVCASRCDTFLPLDELKEIEPTKIGAVALMIGNGAGKSRSNQGGPNRHRHEWRVHYLLIGEISVQDHIREGNGNVHAGHEVRVPDISSNAGVGLGIFEQLHGDADGKAFSQTLANETRNHFGHAGPDFVRWLFKYADRLDEGIREQVKRVSGEIGPAGASHQVARVADRFALVAVAGELATKAGITGWEKGEATHAARACLNAWIDARGGLQNRESMEAVSHVRKMIAAHGRGRYIAWERTNDSKAPTCLTRSAGDASWLLPAVLSNTRITTPRATADARSSTFMSAACFDKNSVLVRTRNSCWRYSRRADICASTTGRNTLAVRLPGMDDKKLAQCIVITSAILSDD